MIRRLLVLSVAMAALLCAGMAVAADEAALVEKGKAVYDAAKPACKACHNEKKNPLESAKVPDGKDAGEWVAGWIRTPKKMFEETGKKGMMPAYSDKKMSDDDVKALTAYLMSLQ